MVPREMKVVYALTTDGVDAFSISTRVSAASVRVSNREVRLTLVCDRASAAAMEARRDPLVNEVDQLVVCEVPDGSRTFRNRFIKTNLLSLLDGPLLYLDGDTFVQGDLASVFALDVDVAGAPNNSGDTFEEQIFPDDYSVLTRLGWQVRFDVFVNGGVMFLNDTSGAQQFVDLWHTKYLESVRATGAYRDQPALNAALAEVPSFRILPHRYNAQFRFNPYSAMDAIVLHFFSSGGFALFAPTQYDNLISCLLRGEPLRLSDVESLVHKRTASHAVNSKESIASRPHPRSVLSVLQESELVARIRQLERSIAEKDAQILEAKRQAAAIESSTFWKATYPLRKMITGWPPGLRRAARTGAKLAARPILRTRACTRRWSR
jgi:hypothetical protein